VLIKVVRTTRTYKVYVCTASQYNTLSHSAQSLLLAGHVVFPASLFAQTFSSQRFRQKSIRMQKHAKMFAINHLSFTIKKSNPVCLQYRHLTR